MLNAVADEHSDDTVARWRIPLAAFFLTLLVAGIGYWDTVAGVAAIWWRSQTFAHGMVIIPISVFLAWRRRDRLKRLAPMPWLPGLILAGLCVGAWVVASVADVQVIQQLAVFALIPVFVLVLFGSAVARVVMFPLAYLFFAVPVGEFLVPPLQDFTAAFAVKSLQLSGVPVFLEGRYISIPEGNFVVAEACSGVRYLIASVALGCLYAYLSYRNWRHRVVFVAAAALVPILANGIRAYGIIMLARLSDMRLATSVDHVIYGWLFFGVVMTLLFWIGSFWIREDGQADHSQVRIPAMTAAGSTGSMLLASAGLWLIVASGAAAAGLLQAEKTGLPLAPVAPPAVDPWVGPSSEVTLPWIPRFEGNPLIKQWTYHSAGGDVHLLTVTYTTEGQGDELLNLQNKLYDGQVWRRLGERRLPPEAMGALGHGVIETMMESTRSRRVSWHWYRIGAYTTISGVKGKLLGAWQRLRGQAPAAMLVAIGADYEFDPESARRVLGEFTATMSPALRVLASTDVAVNTGNRVQGDRQ